VPGTAFQLHEKQPLTTHADTIVQSRRSHHEAQHGRFRASAAQRTSQAIAEPFPCDAFKVVLSTRALCVRRKVIALMKIASVLVCPADGPESDFLL
jgi:hypothetical protein